MKSTEVLSCDSRIFENQYVYVTNVFSVSTLILWYFSMSVLRCHNLNCYAIHTSTTRKKQQIFEKNICMCVTGPDLSRIPLNSYSSRNIFKLSVNRWLTCIESHSQYLIGFISLKKRLNRANSKKTLRRLAVILAVCACLIEIHTQVRRAFVERNT